MSVPEHTPVTSLLPQCIDCGYYLNTPASSGKCPECGAEYDLDWADHFVGFVRNRRRRFFCRLYHRSLTAYAFLFLLFVIHLRSLPGWYEWAEVYFTLFVLIGSFLGAFTNSLKRKHRWFRHGHFRSTLARFAFVGLITFATNWPMQIRLSLSIPAIVQLIERLPRPNKNMSAVTDQWFGMYYVYEVFWEPRKRQFHVITTRGTGTDTAIGFSLDSAGNFDSLFREDWRTVQRFYSERYFLNGKP